MAQNLSSAAVVSIALRFMSDLCICAVGLMAGKTKFVSTKQQNVHTASPPAQSNQLLFHSKEILSL